MKYLSEKLKSLTASVLAIAFIAAFAISCGTTTQESDASEEAEATEQTESSEHPSEHPTEAPADETEPADTVATDTTSVE